MDYAALVAVELRRARRRAVRHAHELFFAIDIVGDAAALVFREEEKAAVLEGFGRFTPRHEYCRAEDLGVSSQPERDWRTVRRERILTRRRRLLRSGRRH